MLFQDSPLLSDCYSPEPGESKGQLLVSLRVERGAGFLPTRAFYYDPSTMTRLEKRLHTAEATQQAAC